ncbi:tryptophan halogenase family protein [Sphingomonas carotinifaciens]|uniref:tryptophan halogenase family protein n=1 Tax=Sphingomonas carotinifaciens TaxID=1166323 RepID=UPI000DD8FB4A|nr:tryptophan halogenase family protein [Sphingomonas carotinifaciens]
MSDPLRSIVIVGGGTAGWMAATYLARRLSHLRPDITVIESPAIGTVGVGEATVPAIRDFLAAVELGEPEVLRETEGTIKYGIRFVDWQTKGHAFFHPFGLYGVPAGGVSFHHHWLRAREAGDATPLDAYCLATQLADHGLFLAPPDRPENDLGHFNFALHFDAVRFAHLLSRLAIANGVRHVPARIDAVMRDPQSGDVSGVRLESGAVVRGDLWIDCSGFRSLLLGEAMGVPYRDWREWLPCDRAVAMPCAPAGAMMHPRTTATALPAGWQWHIPLRHRIGNGYVYCSDHVSDDEAEQTLRDRLEGAPLGNANRLRFTPGHRAEVWHRNVVGVGLASGFLEPLESTSISLVQSGLQRLVQLWPQRDIDPRLAAVYNRQSVLEFERIRDFLLIHYMFNRRIGEPFWDRMRAIEPPDHLRMKLDSWRACGEFVRYEWESFQDPSWLSLYAGLNQLPAHHSMLADAYPMPALSGHLASIRASIARVLAHGERHDRFLARVAAG